MASFYTLEFTLASAVADDGTVTGIAYPSGTTQATFTGGALSNTGKAIINYNDVYNQADPGVAITYGASTITLTNQTGVTWLTESTVLLQLGYVGAVLSEEGVTATLAEINTLDLSARQSTIVATSDGLTTGLLTTASFGCWHTVTSANANNIVTLPAAGADFIGGVIEGWVGATGFEFRAAGTAATINGLDCKTTNELAVPATHRFRLTLVAAETWLFEGDTELGARVTAVPDVV
jgi:hypothetical protein